MWSSSRPVRGRSPKRSRPPEAVEEAHPCQGGVRILEVEEAKGGFQVEGFEEGGESGLRGAEVSRGSPALS
jgi:hypothetical protein